MTSQQNTRSTATTRSTSSSQLSLSSLSSSLPSLPSSSLVRTVTLKDMKDIDTTTLDRPLNVLVTIHDIKPLYKDVYVHGLGLWITYIIERYLVERNIPHRLYTKSILTSGSTKTTPEDFIKFVKRHKIDVCIPSDVTDTMFLSTHHTKISQHVNFAVTNNVSVYKMLEDKWETYNICKQLDILTADTELIDVKNPHKQIHQYPFFLKVSSGTNAGRGVWHCKNAVGLKEALQSKEITKRDDDDIVLIKQKPVSGDIITAQIIFRYGTPVGFFFCQSVQSEDLQGMGANWVKSQRDDVKDLVSDIKVELTDKQWEELHKTFTKIGNRTLYHGMMDIEFIVNPTEGLFLLECNPRFSGGLHTTLSNAGFLDLYFDVVDNKNDSNQDNSPICGNYSAGVDLKARLGDFDPTGFYLKHPLKVLSLRHWSTDDHHTYRPQPQPLPLPSSTPLSSSPSLKNKISKMYQKQQQKVTASTA